MLVTRVIIIIYFCKSAIFIYIITHVIQGDGQIYHFLLEKNDENINFENYGQILAEKSKKKKEDFVAYHVDSIYCQNAYFLII